MVVLKAKKYISPLNVNGLNGRLLRMQPPSSKNKQIFLLYGHHASLERMFGLAEVLNRYGSVTMPDLPGFGGMDSFYKIGQVPGLENYADYLASLIKLHYKRRRITIIAMSFSVPLVVRTLQKYPELARKVDLFVSIAGFVHRDDFIFNKKTDLLLKSMASLFSYRLPALFAKKIFLTKPVIKATYLLTSSRHSKMKDAPSKAELNRRIDFETSLWKMNDVRTRTTTMNLMFSIDLCAGPKLSVPACHVTATEDRYFDHKIVEQHLRVIFSNLEVIASEMPNHAPTIVATAKEAAPYIPKRLRQLLN